MRRSFELPLDALGALLVVFTGSYLVSSSFSGRVLERLGLAGTLVLAAALLGGGFLGYAVVPDWWLLVAAAVPAGAGGGLVDAAVNTWAALRHGPRLMSWLHGCYGLGATLGPLGMTGILAAGTSWRLGYVGVGVLWLGLAGAIAAGRAGWRIEALEAARRQPRGGRDVRRRALARGATWLGVGVFFAYTGVEVSVGIWSYSILVEARGVAPVVAGAWVSVFWGGFTVGRFVSGVLVQRVLPARLVRGSLSLSLAGAALFAARLSPTVSGLALLVVGFGFAPVFPCLMSTTPRRLPEAEVPSGIGLQVAAAALGGGALPAALGLLAGALGLEAIAAALVLAIAGVLVFSEILERFARAPARPAQRL